MLHTTQRCPFVVCTPRTSGHRYPTVATCNDTSRHYIRVYSCVYTSLHRILHTSIPYMKGAMNTGRTCTCSVGILQCTVGTPVPRSLDLRGNEQGAKGTPTGHGQEDPPRSGSIVAAIAVPCTRE